MKKKKLVSMLGWATLLAHNNIHPLEKRDTELLMDKIRESFNGEEQEALVYMESKLLEYLKELREELIDMKRN